MSSLFLLYSPAVLRLIYLLPSTIASSRLSRQSPCSEHTALVYLPFVASGNIGHELYGMDALILQPSEQSQHLSIVSTRKQRELRDTYRVASLSGGRVENDSAQPLTVLRAAVSFDWLFFPNFLSADLALSSVESFTAATASSPQHLFACELRFPGSKVSEYTLRLNISLTS